MAPLASAVAPSWVRSSEVVVPFAIGLGDVPCRKRALRLFLFTGSSELRAQGQARGAESPAYPDPCNSEGPALEVKLALGGSASSWWLKPANHRYRLDLQQILIRGPTSLTDHPIIQESA